MELRLLRPPQTSHSSLGNRELYGRAKSGFVRND